MSVLASFEPTASASAELFTSSWRVCCTCCSPVREVTHPVIVRDPEFSPVSTNSVLIPTGTLHPPSNTLRHARSAAHLHSVCQCVMARHNARASKSSARVSMPSAPWLTAWYNVGGVMSDEIRAFQPSRRRPALARMRAVNGLSAASSLAIRVFLRRYQCKKWDRVSVAPERTHRFPR